VAQTYSILGDSPVDTSRDCLNFGKFVTPFAERLIQSVDNTPFTVGILADWGQGKSTVMRMLQSAVRERQCPTAWFEPWKYNGREAVWKGLALTLVAEIRKDQTLRSELRRKKEGLKTFAAKALWARLIGREWAEDLVETVRSEPWSPSLLHEFEENFETLFEHIDPERQKREQAGQARPFVLFVDDLDRCLPEAALAVLEALKLVLNRPGLITVMGIAEGELSRAVTAAYARETKDVKDVLDPDWGRKYMRKVIQMPFPLPVISDASFEEYVGTCLKASGIEAGLEGDARWRAIIRDACQSNLREVKRFLNHLISEMDKADANESAAGVAQELDPRRVTFTLLLGWRFAPFVEFIRRQVGDRDLLVRYQLFFAQQASGQKPDAALLQDPEGQFHGNQALATFFNQCLASTEDKPALVVPFSTWVDVQPYLQFGARTASVVAAPAGTVPPPSAPPPDEPTEAQPGPAAMWEAFASRFNELLERIQALIAAGQLEEADREAVAAIDVAENVGATTAQQQMLWYLRGTINEARGLGSWATGHYERALALAKSVNSPQRSAILLGLARTHRDGGPGGPALQYARTAREVAHEHADALGELSALIEIADCHTAYEAGTEAEAAYQDAFELASRIQHQPGQLMVLERVSRMLRAVGRPDENALTNAERIAFSLGDRRALARLHIERGLIQVITEKAEGTPRANEIMREAFVKALVVVRDSTDLTALRVYLQTVDPQFLPTLDEVSKTTVRT
jgi:hypothetical protein